MPVNLSSLFSAVNEVSPVNNKEAQSAENAGKYDAVWLQSTRFFQLP